MSETVTRPPKLSEKPLAHLHEFGQSLCIHAGQVSAKFYKPRRSCALFYVLSFLTILVGRYADGRIGASDNHHTPLVRSIRQYLEAHFHEDPSLSDLSELTGAGRFALLRQFRREVGLPPHGYLTQVRLREARRQLLGGDHRL